LSSIVDPEDVDRSIRLMKKSLRDFGFEPETGKIDIDRAEGLRLTSVQRNRVRVMLDIVDELTGIYGRDIPIEEVLKRARVEGVDKPDEILKKMQSEGILYSSRPDVVTKI